MGVFPARIASFDKRLRLEKKSCAKMLHGNGERMRNRCRTMNSFHVNPVRQHRLNSNGSNESSRTRSHSLCECYPKPQKSRSGSDTHITMGCIHATESNFELRKVAVVSTY